jgi:hypothetical protein
MAVCAGFAIRIILNICPQRLILGSPMTLKEDDPDVCRQIDDIHHYIQ